MGALTQAMAAAATAAGAEIRTGAEVASIAVKDGVATGVALSSGEEISADVIDGRQFVVFDQAENRLHVQKAVLEMLLLQR